MRSPKVLPSGSVVFNNLASTHASEIAGTLLPELPSAYAARSKTPGLARGTSAVLGRQNF